MKLTEEKGTYAQAGIIHIYGSFQTNGSSAPTVIRDGNSRLITGAGSSGSVVRTSAGLYTVTMDGPCPIPSILLNAWVGNHCLSSPTSMFNAYFVDGSYSTTTRSFQILVTSGNPLPALTSGQAVASNTCTLTKPGYILQVQATAGTSTGIKTIILSGAPAAGQVAVTYNASGIPTFTFNATDAITTCQYVQISQQVVDADANVRIDFELVGSIMAPGTDPA